MSYYRQEWEKVNLEFHDNATVTFQQRKVFYFDPELSAGDEEDMVVVPNIPMLVIFSLVQNNIKIDACMCNISSSL